MSKPSIYTYEPPKISERFFYIIQAPISVVLIIVLVFLSYFSVPITIATVILIK